MQAAYHNVTYLWPSFSQFDMFYIDMLEIANIMCYTVPIDNRVESVSKKYNSRRLAVTFDNRKKKVL